MAPDEVSWAIFMGQVEHPCKQYYVVITSPERTAFVLRT